MFEVNPSWLWLLALVLFIILEAVTVQMVAVWFMVGCVAAYLVSLFNVGVIWEIVVFVIASGLSLVFLRPLLKKKIDKDRVPTNADMVVGKVGIVTETVDNDECKGRVYALNLDWAARSYDDEIIEKGEKVNVCAIDGVKLIVVPITETEKEI